MVNVNAYEAKDMFSSKEITVKCPCCGTTLEKVVYADGVVLLRVKCRKCKRYIGIDIATKEHRGMEQR